MRRYAGRRHLVIETANVVLDEKRAASSVGPLVNVPAGEYVALSVTDTGTGMSSTTMARVFDPFFTTKPLGQGTGLGLSMIYGFVQQSGGHIHLRSEVGQGTTVTIYLPRHLGAMNGAEVDTVAGLPAKGSAVVLVVEDELPIRMVIADVLSDLGYTVLEAGDGRSALKILETGTLIDLLITDVGLPGGTNGRQLADTARQRRPDLKVLFITGYAESADVGNGLMEQGMQVMTKPFALEALAAMIQGILGN
jgi:CheY-like chemotaxis protein